MAPSMGNVEQEILEAIRESQVHPLRGDLPISEAFAILEHPTGPSELTAMSSCDTPNPGCPLTTRQPAEYLFVSYRETHT